LTSSFFLKAFLFSFSLCFFLFDFNFFPFKIMALIWFDISFYKTHQKENLEAAMLKQEERELGEREGEENQNV